MKKKEKHEVVGDLDDMLYIFCVAMRYGLGRKTFASLIITEFITDNLGLLNKKWLVNLLRDVNRYDDERGRGFITDDECDYQKWMGLKTALQTEFHSRNFGETLAYYGLDGDVNAK